MHERAAVTAALNGMMAETGGAVARVVAAIGPDVDPAVVEAIWDEIVADTPAVSAELVCDPAPDLLRCLTCGADYPGSKLEVCSVCGGDGLVIRVAPEFVVRGWEPVS